MIIIRFKTLASAISVFCVYQAAMAINISESDLPPPDFLEFDGSQSYVLDLGLNVFSGSFSITKDLNPIPLEYVFDLDNFEFVVSAGHQLDSLLLELHPATIEGNDPDWGSGSLNYIIPAASSFLDETEIKLDPHAISTIGYPMSGSFPVGAGTYNYVHELSAVDVDDAPFTKVTTPYTITIELSSTGGGSPVPDSGSTMLLSILGLSCLFSAKRYSKK